MRREHAVRQEITQLRLGPTADDEPRNEMQVGAWVDVVSNARSNDREDMGGALTPLIEPREEPVFSAQDKASKLALSAVVCGVDVSVFEEEQEPRPLAVKVAERLAERRLGRDVASLLVEPLAELLKNGPRILLATSAPRFGAVALASGLPLDGEEGCDEADPFERDGIAAPRGHYEPPPCMAPASWTLSARALEEGQDACPIALHRPNEVFAEEASHAVRVTTGGIEEGHPTSVGPAPHGPRADAKRCRRVENGNAGRVGAEQARAACLLFDEPRHGGDQIDGGSHAASERLRGDVHAPACPATALSLDGKVLDVLVADRFHDERVAELAALDDLGRRGSRDDGVVVGTSHRLVQPLLDDDPRGDDVDGETARMRHGLHLCAAARADTHLGGDGVGHRHALQVRRRSGSSGVPPLATLLRVGALLVSELRRGRRNRSLEWKQELALEAFQRF